MFPLRQLLLTVLAALALAVSLSGCGTLSGFGQVGPNLKPTAGASVSIPLGK